MGCANSRDVGVEERCITAAEQGLGFHKINVVDIDNVFRKYSSNGIVTQSQLIYISNSLNFRILNSGIHTHIQLFFQSQKKSEGNYELNDLLLIALMLGKGKPGLKAKLIYEMFDPQLTHQLEISEIKEKIVRKMISLSANALPSLVCSEFALPENEIKVHKYKKKIMDVVELAVEDLINKLLVRGKIISQDTFVEIFSTYLDGQLVTPTGIRKLLFDLRLKNPKQRKSRRTETYGKTETIEKTGTIERSETTERTETIDKP